MNTQIELPNCTLPTEHQAILDTVNQLLALVPDNEDAEVVLRLGMVLLEMADVAPQSDLAAVGYRQTRSVRVYKDRLQADGLAGLFDRPIPGRPAVTTQVSVERALIQVILQAVIEEQVLPKDETLCERVNRFLSEQPAPHAEQVTPSMVETIRLRWGIQRPSLKQALQAAQTSTPAEEQAQLGRTQVGGAFILAILLVETGWLNLAKRLPIAAGYAVTATQWLLTSVFSVIFNVRRAFHLDDVCDIGFALLTGRPRPLSHSTFQHIARAISEKDAKKFYDTSAKREVDRLGKAACRISVDGHNLPRYTHVVDLAKGKIGNTGRILKAEELVLAYALDDHVWLGLRAYHGTNKLSTGLVEVVADILKWRGPDHGVLRVFFDKGGACGHVVRDLLECPQVLFYTLARRSEENVHVWEKLDKRDFDRKRFSFDKHMPLPTDQRPTYLLADTEMIINVWENRKLIGSLTVRAIVLHNPLGQTPAERWPVVLLTNDRLSDARDLLNEYGDHWGQEFAHRIGRHDLFLDILPAGYVLTTHRDEEGNLRRQVEFDNTAFFLSAWLRCLVFNLMSRFAQAMGGEYANMWAGTLLRKFIRRPATLYLIGKELYVVFDPFPGQDELQPVLDELNAKRTALPWLNNLVVQFSIAQEEHVHPLTEPEKRNRLFGDG